MTVPVRRIPRQRRRDVGARLGFVYLILTRPVDLLGNIRPGPPEVGYIGQTRYPELRAAQHRADQPFADLIVNIIIIDQGVWDKAQLDAREEMWIRAGAEVGGRRAQLPRYNHDHNLGNPDRVEVWRAVEQRQRREPGWQPSPKSGARPTLPRVRRPAPRGHLDMWWQRNRWWVAAWSALWGVCVVLAWWAGAGSWSGMDEARNALLLGTRGWAVVVWRAVKARKPRRRRRSGRRR